MSFKIFYCIKASNDIMTSERIYHFDENLCNVIVILCSYLMQTRHNKPGLTIIKNIKTTEKLLSPKNNDQLKKGHFLT